MNTHFKKTVIRNSFDSLIPQLEEALKVEGFALGGKTSLSTGALSKNGAYVSTDVVLSAYVPFLYEEMLLLAPFEGLILPCLISVVELHPGEIAIVPFNPTASIVAEIHSPSLQNLTEEVSRRMDRAIRAIQGGKAQPDRSIALRIARQQSQVTMMRVIGNDLVLHVL